MQNKNFIKKIGDLFSRKIFILILFIALAICGATCARNAKERAEKDPFLSLHEEMTKEIIASQKRIDEIFAAHQKQMEKTFAKLENQGSNSTKILNYSDNDFYYYELDFKGFKKEEVVVEIKDGILTFSGQKQAKKIGSESAYAAQDFYYSFALPQYDKSISPDVSRLDNKIIVKLKQVK